MSQAPRVGTIGWVDLTIPNAPEIRDFYCAVVGWTSSDVDMGDYTDFALSPEPRSSPVAGLCHARGENAKLPPVWLVYITVADLDASVARCLELGGKVLSGPKDAGNVGRFCVIEDPAGAVSALFQPNPD